MNVENGIDGGAATFSSVAVAVPLSFAISPVLCGSLDTESSASIHTLPDATGRVKRWPHGAPGVRRLRRATNTRADGDLYTEMHSMGGTCGQRGPRGGVTAVCRGAPGGSGQL